MAKRGQMGTSAYQLNFTLVSQKPKSMRKVFAWWMRSLILVNTNELIFAINSQPTYFLALKYDPFSPSAADASFGALRTFVLNLNQN